MFFTESSKFLSFESFFKDVFIFGKLHRGRPVGEKEKELAVVATHGWARPKAGGRSFHFFFFFFF